MANERLVGNDGYIATFEWGSEVIGNTGTPITIPANTWVLITDKATTGSKFGDIAKNQVYISPVAITTNTTGDKWKLATETKLTDLKGFSINKTVAEIDVTVLEDDSRVYRRGKEDADGSAQFIYISGVTDAEGGLANYFYELTSINSTGVPTVYPKLTDDLFMVGYLNKGDYGDGTKTAIVFKANFFGFPLNMTEDSAVEIDVNFRLAPGLKPAIYTIAPSA